MKKIFFALLLLMSIVVCNAQPNYEYCDVYARGSWNNLNITIMYKQHTQYMRGNIGTVLNKMADLGWELQESIVIPRKGIHVTRHKIHFILRRHMANDVTNQNHTENSKRTAIQSKTSSVAHTESDEGGKSNTTINDTELMVEFKSGEIAKLDIKSLEKKLDKFYDEISANLDIATTAEELTIIKEKIKILELFNQSLPRKNFSIVDKVHEFKYHLKRKEKKIGLEDPFNY